MLWWCRMWFAVISVLKKESGIGCEARERRDLASSGMVGVCGFLDFVLRYLRYVVVRESMNVRMRWSAY